MRVWCMSMVKLVSEMGECSDDGEDSGGESSEE